MIKLTTETKLVRIFLGEFNVEIVFSDKTVSITMNLCFFVIMKIS